MADVNEDEGLLTGHLKLTSPSVRQLLSLWYIAVVILTPLVLMPLLTVYDTPQSRCAYAVILVAVLWVTEALPLPVTSLIPIFLLPVLGLLKAEETARLYMSQTSLLFFGSVTMAVAIEQLNFHRRLGLSVMYIVGTQPECLLLGMMVATWFLSLWVSNTIATTMMMPIVQAVLDHFEETVKIDKSIPKCLFGMLEQDDVLRSEDVDTVDGNERPSGSHSLLQLRKAMSISIAYASSIGGIGSLIGTEPNMILLAEADMVFRKVGLKSPLTFTTWFVYGLPLSVASLVLVWALLLIVFLRCRNGCGCLFSKRSGKIHSKGEINEQEEFDQKVGTFIKSEFLKLGPISCPEITLLVFFAMLVFLWITRDSVWGKLLKSGYVTSDETLAILAAVLLFVIPSRLPDIFFQGSRYRKSPSQPLKPILSWKTVNAKMPWSILFLLGGGYSLAEASKVSGLSLLMGTKLTVFSGLNKWLILTVICYIISFTTEIITNTALVNIILPIVSDMALTLKINPLLFMFPATIACSFAFMLPVGTPPNDIVFSYGTIKIMDMAGIGFIINIITVPLLLLVTATIGNAFFNFDTIPPEFLTSNSTLMS